MQRTGADSVVTSVFGLLLAALTAGCAQPEAAVDREAEKRASFTREEIPGERWQEMETVFPPYPLEKNLIKMQLTGPATFTFLVDQESINVGDDAVVRYTVVARSRTGTDNVIFEGLRCEDALIKPYAFGTADKTWAPASGEDWSPITKRQRNDYRHDLYKFYFCVYGYPQRDSDRAIAALKRGIPLPEDRGH